MYMVTHLAMVTWTPIEEDEMTLSKEEVEFIERFGRMSESDGMPRTGGRMYGLLLLQEEALSLGEMAEMLQVSKASVSTNARRLEQMDVVEKTTKPGDRRDYYRIGPQAFEERMRRIRGRLEEMVESVEVILPAVDGEKRPKSRQRLRLQLEWHRFLLREMDDLEERWSRSQVDDEDEERG